MSLLKNNKFLGALVAALVIAPLVLPLAEAEFAGADDQAEGLIGEISPDYQPWFSSIWEPPSGEVESLLFALQAAIGSAVLFYYIGYRRGQAHRKD